MGKAVSTIQRFEEIEAWIISRDLSNKIWKISCQGSFEKDFGLRRQINSASGSVMDNIAEGFGRGGTKEFVNFLSYARASNNEVQSQLYRALDRKHIDRSEFQVLQKMSINVSVKISNLMNYLRKSELRCIKFKT